MFKRLMREYVLSVGGLGIPLGKIMATHRLYGFDMMLLLEKPEMYQQISRAG